MVCDRLQVRVLGGERVRIQPKPVEAGGIEIDGYLSALAGRGEKSDEQHEGGTLGKHDEGLHFDDPNPPALANWELCRFKI